MKKVILAVALMFAVCTAHAATLLSVESCKQHGTVGLFCIPGGEIEPRSGSAMYVYTFDAPIQSAPYVYGVTMVSGQTISVTSVSISGSTVTVLFDPIDQQYNIIHMQHVNGDPAVLDQVTGFLIGDVDSDRIVTLNDRDLVRNQSGQAVDGTNFLLDINRDGVIDASDIVTVRARVGHAL